MYATLTDFFFLFLSGRFVNLPTAPCAWNVIANVRRWMGTP